jgi:hypothetical protein
MGCRVFVDPVGGDLVGHDDDGDVCSQLKRTADSVVVLATYPSRDMIAYATTLPIVHASSVVLRAVNVHHDAAGERGGLHQVQVPRARQLVEKCPSLAQNQRLDQVTIFVDEARRSQSAGEPSAAHTITSGPGSALIAATSVARSPRATWVTGQVASASLRVLENTTFGNYRTTSRMC